MPYPRSKGTNHSCCLNGNGAVPYLSNQPILPYAESRALYIVLCPPCFFSSSCSSKLFARIICSETGSFQVLFYSPVVIGNEGPSELAQHNFLCCSTSLTRSSPSSMASKASTLPAWPRSGGSANQPGLTDDTRVQGCWWVRTAEEFETGIVWVERYGPTQNTTWPISRNTSTFVSGQWISKH